MTNLQVGMKFKHEGRSMMLTDGSEIFLIIDAISPKGQSVKAHTIIEKDGVETDYYGQVNVKRSFEINMDILNGMGYELVEEETEEETTETPMNREDRQVEAYKEALTEKGLLVDGELTKQAKAAFRELKKAQNIASYVKEMEEIKDICHIFGISFTRACFGSSDVKLMVMPYGATKGVMYKATGYKAIIN